MKKIDLGRTIGILANVGVIAGIILLAFELQQNNALLEAQARYTRTTQWSNFSAEILGNSEVPVVLAKVANDEALSDSDQIILFAFGVRVLRGWEWQYGEFTEGALDSLRLDEMRNIYHERVAIPYRLAETWEDVRAVFDADFVQFMEENIVNEP